MDEREKALFDACIRQAEYFASRWDGRRGYEWKTTVAVWALFAGGTTFVKNLGPWQSQIRLGVEIAALVTIYVFFWLKPIWTANNDDKLASLFYREQAQAIMHKLGLKAFQASEMDRSPTFLGDWSMRFQMLSVIILALVFFTVPRS